MGSIKNYKKNNSPGVNKKPLTEAVDYTPEIFNENNFAKNIVTRDRQPDINNDSIIVKFKQTSNVIKKIPIEKIQGRQITYGKLINLPQSLAKHIPNSITNVKIKKVGNVPHNQPFGDITIIKFDKQSDLQSIETMVRNFNLDPDVEYAEMNQVFYIGNNSSTRTGECSTHTDCNTGEYCHSGWNGAEYGERFCIYAGIADDGPIQPYTDYCSNNPCGDGDGDCDYDSDCDAPGLQCGSDNCPFNGINGIERPYSDCCELIPILGCTDPNACANYNPDANVDDGSCLYDINGDGICDVIACSTHTDCNTGEYCHSGWNGTEYGIRTCVVYTDCYTADYPCGVGDGDCDFQGYQYDGTGLVGGCDEPGLICGWGNCDFQEINGITSATDCCEYRDLNDDGIPDIFQILGCMDETACNYNPDATHDGGVCRYAVNCYYDLDGDLMGDSNNYCGEHCQCPAGCTPNPNDLDDTNPLYGNVDTALADAFVVNNLTWPLYNDGNSGIQWSAIFGQMTPEDTQYMGIDGVDIGWVDAWNDDLFQSNGEPPVIAVLDTGVDIFHRDMVNQVWVNPECEQNGIAINQHSIDVLNEINSDIGTNFQGCRDIIHYLHEHEHELIPFRNINEEYTPQHRTYWISEFYSCIHASAVYIYPKYCNDGYFGISPRILAAGASMGEINYAFDGHGHGTHCAGTVAAEGNNNHGFAGVCPNCKIMSVKVGNVSGALDTEALLLGFYYILQMKLNKGVNIKAINNSWGGGFSQLIQDAVKLVYDFADIVSVFAAGNSAVDMSSGSSARYPWLINRPEWLIDEDTPNIYQHECAYNYDEDFLRNNCSNNGGTWLLHSGGQACLNQQEGSTPGMVVNVSALDAHGDIAWFSNYGNGPYCKVDIAAPGENILSLKPSHAFEERLDMSFPHFNDDAYEDIMIRFFGCNGYDPDNPYSIENPSCSRRCNDAEGGCPGQFDAQGKPCCHNSFDASGQPYFDDSSIFNNYALMSGTSMAAPHISGMIGLIASLYPNLSISEIVDVMKTHGARNISEYLTSSYDNLEVQTLGEIPSFWSPDYGQDIYCDYNELFFNDLGNISYYSYKCSKRLPMVALGGIQYDYPLCYSDQDCLYWDNFCDPDNSGYPCMVEDFTQCPEGSCIGAGMMDIYGLLESYHQGNIGDSGQFTYELRGGNNFISFPFEMDNNSVTDFMIEHNVINVLGQGVGLFNDNGNITGNYTNFEPEHGFTINLPGSNMDNITITISGVQSLSPLVYDLMSLGTNSTYKISYDGLDDMNTIEALGEWENSIEFIIGDGQGLFNECHGTGTSCWEGNLSSLKWGSGYYIQTQGGIAEFQWNRIMMTASSTSTTLPDRDVKNKIKQLGLGNKSEAQQQTPIRPGDSVRDIEPG